MARSALTDLSTSTWTNWVGNRSFTPAHSAAPRDEEEVAALVRLAAERGVGVRVAGAGHSYTPVVETDGLLLDLTATHGSGTRYTSLSGAVRGMRLVAASGEVLDIGEDDPDLLHAAQVSVGMLGVVTRLDLAVTDAYRLREHVSLRSWDEVMEHWDELVSRHRHFGFFWLPTEESGELYNLDGHGERLADQCYVKLYDEVGPDVADDDTTGRRVDRCYRIFPMVYDPNFHELEYFVALQRAPEALQAVRELMRASLPDSVYPMEVRTVGADDAFLSPQHGTDTVVISVSGKPGTDYWPYLRSVDALLAGLDARVHWGKLHFLTPERLRELYPRADDFIALRRELDPQGMFLNDHLRPLFT